jgi:hypothetical protein
MLSSSSVIELIDVVISDKSISFCSGICISDIFHISLIASIIGVVSICSVLTITSGLIFLISFMKSLVSIFSVVTFTTGSLYVGNVLTIFHSVSFIFLIISSHFFSTLSATFCIHSLIHPIHSMYGFHHTDMSDRFLSI